MLTREQKLNIWQRVHDGIVAQGKPSYDDRTHLCQYRLGSLKCAIGQLIDDAYYSESLEGKSADQVDILRALSYSNPGLMIEWEQSERSTHCDGLDVWFFSELQAIHDCYDQDDARFLDSFKRQMDRLRTWIYDLEPETLDQ